MNRFAFAGCFAFALLGCAEEKATTAPASAAPATATKRLPAEAAGPCVLRAATFHDRAPVALALRDRSAPSLSVYGDARDVVLRLTDAGSRLELVSGPLSLAAYVDPRSLDVFPARALPVGAAFVLMPERNLAPDVRAWPHRADASLAVRLDAPFGVETARPIDASLPCAALALESTAFDPFAALGGRGQNAPAMLEAGRRIALADRAGGAPAAFVTLTAEGEPAIVIDARDGFSHVAFVRANMLVHGWVKAADLVVGGAPLRPPVVVATNADRVDFPSAKDLRVCPHELSLYVAEGRARPIMLGRIAKGARVGVLAWERPFTPVTVVGAGAVAEDAARLVVETGELDSCVQP